jgi:hypothetical protein
MLVDIGHGLLRQESFDEANTAKARMACAENAILVKHQHAAVQSGHQYLPWFEPLTVDLRAEFDAGEALLLPDRMVLAV